jgi:hypothetical protein
MHIGAKCADGEGCMRKNVKVIALAFALQIVLVCAGRHAVAQSGKAAYPAMATLDQYLISDEATEIALARSAAPSSISDGAEVMVLGREGYKTAVKGTNGFLCIVERSWAQSEDDAEFWNPKMRAPHCFNAQAAKRLCSDLSDEDPARTGRKIQGRNRARNCNGVGQQGAALVGAWFDGLHDVEAAVLKRPG